MDEREFMAAADAELARLETALEIACDSGVGLVIDNAIFAITGDTESGRSQSVESGNG